MRIFEILEDIEVNQNFPLSQYNQDNGKISWFADQIDQLIDTLDEKNELELLDDYEKWVNLSELKASQSWLSPYGGGDPVITSTNGHIELDEYPIVVDINGEYVIIDGHHRLNRDLERGIEKAKVFLFKF